MHKSKVLLCIAMLGCSQLAQASATTDALFEGARQYLLDSRASFNQGVFTGAVLARGYDSPACLEGKQNKTVLTGVAQILALSPDLRQIEAPAQIIDHALIQAFPCKKV